LNFPEELDLAAFISEEAHDLKSPFNRILGFTKMLMKGMSGPITDMQKDDLTTVYQNGSQAMTMMSNLVDMARLGRGEKSFSPGRKRSQPPAQPGRCLLEAKQSRQTS
jgi:signal transduction histidine kinase